MQLSLIEGGPISFSVSPESHKKDGETERDRKKCILIVSTVKRSPLDALRYITDKNSNKEASKKKNLRKKFI